MDYCIYEDIDKLDRYSYSSSENSTKSYDIPQVDRSNLTFNSFPGIYCTSFLESRKNSNKTNSN